eukprot:UN24691
MDIPESLKTSFACSNISGVFTIIMVLLGFGKYPYLGPIWFRVSHHFLISAIFPALLLSSANHVCLHLTGSTTVPSLSTRGFVPMALY